MFKAVIFDIDGTIYSYVANDKIAVESLCEYAENVLYVDEEEFRTAYNKAKRIVKEERLKDGGAKHSKVLFFQTTLELLGKSAFRYVLEMYDVYWNSFLANMKPFDGAVEFIKKLKSMGVKISLCTDMTAHIQYRKIKKLGLDHLIDFMVTSEETGLEKPARVMFELALQKLNVDAADTAFFGDSLERDIEGAARVGITPFWYNDRGIFQNTNVPCIEVNSYWDIIDSEKFFK
jgi:putative hydrolase of the HAD superfamily